MHTAMSVLLVPAGGRRSNGIVICVGRMLIIAAQVLQEAFADNTQRCYQRRCDSAGDSILKI